MSRVTLSAQPASNQAGMALVGQHLSAAKAEAFRSMGLGVVQGYREGVRLWDLDGKEYINCRCSGGVFNFGHRPAFALEALRHALETLGDMGDWLIPSAARARGAAALARVLSGGLCYVFFTPGGGEAVEVACKLARGVTGRRGIVSAEHGFHGQVGFALAMDEDRDSRWFAPLVPDVTKVPFGDLAAVDRTVDDRTAAVCMETIPATAGYLVPPVDFWPGVREICDERGALLILDEVQCGLGRTGTIWACEHWGVWPDFLVTGKGLSGGVYPIAACCFGEKVDSFFAQDPFFHPSSYGGSELGAAVVEAVIDKITEPEFLGHVQHRAVRLESGLDDLCRRYPGVLAGRRGLGLMQALDTHSAEVCYSLMVAAIANGVLAVWANNRQETLLVMPPLVIGEADVDEIIARLGRAAAAVHAAR